MTKWPVEAIGGSGKQKAQEPINAAAPIKGIEIPKGDCEALVRVPTYVDGKPANLQAAIVDAEYWLRWLRSRINEQRPPVELNEYRARMRPELIEKLRLAIRALEEFLPDHPEYILSTVEGPTEGIDDDSGNVPPPLPRDGKTRYCKVCSCELDEFNLAKQGDHICRKCKEARQELGPVQQAKFDLIKAKLRAKQQEMNDQVEAMG